MSSRYLVFIGLAFGTLLLAACGRGPAQTWPGVAADSQYVYIAQAQQVHAVDLSNGRQVWAFPKTANNNVSQIVSQPGVGADTIVVGSEGASQTYSGIAYGLDRATGLSKWCLAFDAKGATQQDDAGRPCAEAQGAATSTFLGIGPAVDDRILGGIALTNNVAYFGLASGMVYAVDVATGKDLWHYKTERDVWAAPLVVSDTVYVSSLDHHVYALDRANGNQRWVKDLGAAVAGEAVFDQGILYVGTFGNRMAALDAGTGEEKWSFTTKNWAWSGPAVGKGVLYLTDVSGNVFAIDQATGQQIWTVKPGGEMRARPTLAGDTLYAGDYDGHIFALNTADGSDRWPAVKTSKGQILVTPLVVSSTVVVAPYNGDNFLEAYNPSGVLVWPFKPPQ